MNTRWIAAQVLARVMTGQSLTCALEQAVPAAVSDKDRSFIQALCYGVCRQYHRLNYLLNQLISKPIKDIEIRALILAGLYQLGFMRVKTHAVVSETVAATQKKSWAKALVNGVLRTYLREQLLLDSKTDEVPEASFSHPDWMIKQIRQDWPDQAAEILLENNQQPPMCLRVNQRVISRDQYQLRLIDQGMESQQSEHSQVGILLDRPVSVSLLPGFSEGLVSVQDSAAQLAAELLAIQPGQRVLDVCAAPGGKTTHILEQHPQLTELVAIDIDEHRMQRMHDNFGRLKLSATLMVADAMQTATWWNGKQFQRILLDAPCSASGVIRRHPDIKLLRRQEDIQQLQQLQSALLRSVWPLLAPGGLLLYVTCSIFKQENEQQIESFLKEHPDASESPIIATWGNARTRGRQILTGESTMDGFYYARLVKSEVTPSPSSP